VTVSLSRKYTFCASHRLHSSALTDDENRAIYGKCNNPNGHGHNYEVEVTVRGAVDRVTGRVVALDLLDRLVDEQILAPLRYRNLNEEIDAFRTAVPTTENLAFEVERSLQSVWAGIFGDAGPGLERVRIWETERNICEVATLL
jgi:6-pyruvoyltetrahydropterin/6-carboxytetrahydropterin synthase